MANAVHKLSMMGTVEWLAIWFGLMETAGNPDKNGLSRVVGREAHLE